MQKFPFILGTFVCATPTFAHIGHVGEIAGHGHIIAIAAIVTAAVLASLIAKGRKGRSQNEPDAEISLRDDEQEAARNPA